MRRAYLLLAALLGIHLGDLVVAWLYGGGALPSAALLRPLRDAALMSLAAVALLTVRMPRPLLVMMLAFGSIALAYAPLGYAHGLPAGIVVGSLGTLLLPMLLVLAGFWCMPDPAAARRGARWLVWLGIASALFGVWDLLHTEFWVGTVQLPDYLAQVKGVLPKDTDPTTGLPWNFFGGENYTRRAGGLLAAPLAQGQFLVTAALTVLGLWQRRWPWRALLACLALLVGVWMSGTRGAMLAGIVGVLGYLLTSRGLVRSQWARLALVGVTALALAAASYGIVITAVNFRDGSTIGHWWALQRNLADLHQVMVWGGGLGRQGAVAARQALTDLGGGEGGIFTIAYQMGLPAALLFLAFIGWSLQTLWHRHRRHDDPLALAMFWLLCGMTTTLISSDVAMTVSGAGGFWLLLGGVLRQCRAPQPRPPIATQGGDRMPMTGLAGG
ncbi:O-antigen ligase family protein [Xanthomonas maliensis]|uniref:O-antigen ligase family protein n=1 Tax=Xanthomonas maliensis TaxID=1321368 RepID=UPI00039995D4|nr:membrane protein [Xanthomonas maliensis]